MLEQRLAQGKHSVCMRVTDGGEEDGNHHLLLPGTLKETLISATAILCKTPSGLQGTLPLRNAQHYLKPGFKPVAVHRLALGTDTAQSAAGHADTLSRPAPSVQPKGPTRLWENVAFRGFFLRK